MNNCARVLLSRLTAGGLAAALPLVAPPRTLCDAARTTQPAIPAAALVREGQRPNIPLADPTPGDVDNDGDLDLADYVQFAAYHRGPSYSTLIPEKLPSGITDNTFLNSEYLCRPTSDSITVSLIPAQNVDAYIEYRTAPHGVCRRTEIVYNHPAYQPLELVLAKLQESTRYVYRVRARQNGYLNFEGLQEHEFTTAKRPGEGFTFIIGADSHVAKLYLCGRACRDRLTMSQQVVEQMANDAVDFLIELGDTAMTHIWTQGYPADTQEEAYHRYSIARAHLESLSASVPIFFVLGNHEGETGFEGARHSNLLTMISTNARLRYMPNPTNGLNELENFYAFEWGDALFIVLDPLRYTNIGGGPPDDPQQWTLGAEQLAWLGQTMKGSDRVWKFVFAHHLVGGASEGSSPYPGYGEGGSQYADIGDQRRVQELMEQCGGHFFYGHNHLFAHEVNDGVHYVLTSSYGAPLHTNRVHLFEGAEMIIAEHGYTKVQVARDRFTCSYIGGPSGDVLYEFTVYDR